MEFDFINQDGHVYPVIINLFSTLLYFLIGALGYFVAGRIKNIRSSAFRKFFGVGRGITKVNLVFGLVQTNKKKELYTVEEGDVTALCSALLLLEESFGAQKVDVTSCHSCMANLGDLENIISISGPVWNSVTKRALEQSNLPAYFGEVEGQDALLFNNGLDNKVTTYDKGVARVCYALVMRTFLDNPEGKPAPQRVVLAAGISALGTFGATVWLRRLSNRRINNKDIWRKTRKDNTIAVILKVKDSSPSGFRAFSSGPTKPAFLDVEVIYQFDEGDFQLSTEESSNTTLSS